MQLSNIVFLIIFQNGLSQSVSLASGPSEATGSTHNLVHHSKTTPSIHSMNGAYQEAPFSYQNAPTPSPPAPPSPDKQANEPV